MPKRSWSIDTHPQKAKIIQMIVKGHSFMAIKQRYGIPKSVLSRYLNTQLIPRVAAEIVKRDIKDGNFVLDKIESIMSKMQKLYDACDEYLTDPVDPTKYSLLPRAWEQEIRYLDYSNCKEPGDRPKQETMTVQALIDKLNDKECKMTYIKYKHQDPRKVITDTAIVMTKQLELLARVQGTIKDVTINIVNNPVWVEVQAAILQATSDFPEVRNQLAKKFEKMGGKS